MEKIDKIVYITNQLIGQGNLSIIESDFSADYIAHAGDKTHKGQKFIKQYVMKIRATIPDVKIGGIEIISQTDNTLTWQRTLRGTHIVELYGIPASYKKVKWHELVVSRFEQDKIIEEWIASDLAFQLMLKTK